MVTLYPDEAEEQRIFKMMEAEDREILKRMREERRQEERGEAISKSVELAKIKSQERLAKARLKAQLKAQKKRAGTIKGRFKALTKLRPAPMLSREQRALQEMFRGERTWGTGACLPKIDNILSSGGGLLKTGTGDSTAKLFGFRRRR